MKHAGCPLCSRAGFMKVGGAGGEVFFFFFGWRSAVSLLQVDTLILQQKAAGCGNREILCQQTKWRAEANVHVEARSFFL